MKGLPNEKSSAIFNKSDGYQIIGYRDEDYECGKDKKYFILDDNFIIHAISKNRLILLDEDKDDFVKVYDTDYVKVFMDENFKLVYQKSLLKNENLDYNCEIWDRTWLAYSLRQKGIELNEELDHVIQDESHKINYIHGLLDFATDFMNFETLGDANYDISFSKENIDQSRLRFETEHFKKIKKDVSEETIIEFIEDFLFKGNKIKNFDGGSNITSRKVFLLIESLIANEKYIAYNYNDGYKSYKIILESNGFYYILNLDESD